MLPPNEKISDSACTAPPVRLVLVGHVDHGKSTVLGRLLADSKALPEGKLEEIEKTSARLGKRFEYAFLLDALADERSQGITIDAARVHFASETRRYLFIDAPGHIEFLKNMVTGASRADAAVLVVDAAAGLEENSRRHAYLLSLMGINEVIVLCNKMDLVDFDESAFLQLQNECRQFLSSINITPKHIIPVSGECGDNLVNRSKETGWYKGLTLFDAFEEIRLPATDSELPLRMYVQDVYKFTKFDDDRRIVVGTIDAGGISQGEAVTFFPSGKTSTVKSIESFGNGGSSEASAGVAVGFTLEEQIYVRRGELLTRASDSRPKISSLLRASVFWLGREPLSQGRNYQLQIGTAKVTAQLTRVLKVINSSSLTSKTECQAIERNEVAECELQLRNAVAFDEVTLLQKTSRFVLIDKQRIAGGGIVQEALIDATAAAREQAFLRESKWISSGVATQERAERFAQRPTLVLVSGPQDTPRKEFARLLEARLFTEGRNVYYTGIGNIIHGLDADLDAQTDAGDEHIRRLAEVANLLLHAGMMFIVSAVELSQADITLIKGLIRIGELRVLAFEGSSAGELEADLLLTAKDLNASVEQSVTLFKGQHLVS